MIPTEITALWWTHIGFPLLCKWYFRATHECDRSRNAHWFICLSVKTKTSNAYPVKDRIPPQFHQLQISMLYLVLEPKEQCVYIQSLIKTHQSAFRFNSVGKKGTKFGSQERTDMFNKIKTWVQEWHRLKYYIVLEWCRNRVVLKHTIPKDHLVWDRKRHFTPHCSLPWLPSLPVGLLISSNEKNVIWFTESLFRILLFS